MLMKKIKAYGEVDEKNLLEAIRESYHVKLENFEDKQDAIDWNKEIDDYSVLEKINDDIIEFRYDGLLYDIIQGEMFENDNLEKLLSKFGLEFDYYSASIIHIFDK